LHFGRRTNVHELARTEHGFASIFGTDTAVSAVP
jgi:hypothetical protein